MKTTKMIESYLDGSLVGQELEDFKQAIASQPELAKEVDLHREVNESLKDDMSEKFKSSLAEAIRKAKAQKRNKIRYFSAAAAIAILMISIISVPTKQDPEKVFEKYYAPYEADFIQRSSKLSKKGTTIAYEYYQSADYQKCFELLDQHLEHTPSDAVASFYMGLSALELNFDELAIEYLSKEDLYKGSAFSSHAKWYLGLSYLKTNQKKDAEAVFSQLAHEKNFYQERSQAILNNVF